MHGYGLMAAVAAVLLAGDSVDAYFIDRHTGCNAVANAASEGESTKWVTYLGEFDTTDACIAACIAASSADNPCQSYTYHNANFTASYARHCYGRFGVQYGTMWIPVADENVDCGRVIRPCTSDAHCQFNGVCNTQTGNCSCDAGWGGYTCQELQFLPAVRGAGLNQSAQHMSTWGGSVLMDRSNPDNATKYHMYTAEMQNHCGINSWTANSALTHAQSTDGATGAYERKAVLAGPFAHEPNAMLGPNGEFAVLYAYYNYSLPLCNCTDGSTPPGCQGPPVGLKQEVLEYADKPAGPFTKCVVFADRSKYPVLTDIDDTNMAGVVLPNGSFVGMLRHAAENGSMMHLVTAPDWKDCDSYTIDQPLLFPNLPMMGAEDPYIYRDCKGRFHAIVHNGAPMFNLAVTGGHAFSEDGRLQQHRALHRRHHRHLRAQGASPPHPWG
eukprot:TRINITY_DN1716_c0_g1_i10.p1 TRINITY_DN1716_c0_g1~~TRINITY_DN1716_c0_g1_i10.p1  ORF type:complete len:441 (+),score=147.92 TRINITY_DN1716_c0_g1_i10:183-1505(+)